MAFESIPGLVNRLGNIPYTLRRVTQGEYQPGGSGDYAETTVETWSGLCVLEDYREMLVDGVRIQQGDSKVHIAVDGLATDPQPNDRITIRGEEYSVVKATWVSFGGSGVLWTLQVRRGD